MSYMSIPATIVPQSYIPIIAYGLHGKYIYQDCEDIIDCVLYPRKQDGYDLNKGIVVNKDSRNIMLYINNKRTHIDIYELLRENDKEIQKIEDNIKRNINDIRRNR